MSFLFTLFIIRLSIPPWSIFPLSSSNHNPFLEFLHSFNSSLLSNNFKFLHSELLYSSGGSFPFSINLSKCFFKTPSMQEGREGNIPVGRCQTSCSDSQKQRGHSRIKLSVELESLLVILLLLLVALLKQQSF